MGDPAAGRGQARSGRGWCLPEVERNGGCKWRKMERRGLRVKSIDTCGSEHKGLEDVGEGDDAPRVLVLVHQNQAMDLWVQAEHHRHVGQRAGGLALVRGTPAAHLLLGNAVDDVFHSFVGVAGEDPLQADGALPQCLPHADVQVVVGLLGCQVLRERWPRSAPPIVLTPRGTPSPDDTQGRSALAHALVHVGQVCTGTGMCERPTGRVQGATLVPECANTRGTHNDVKPRVEADHLPCKERQHRGWGGGPEDHPPCSPCTPRARLVRKGIFGWGWGWSHRQREMGGVAGPLPRYQIH